MHARCPSPCFLDCRPRSLSNVVAFCFRPFAFVICRRRRRHCRRHCRRCCCCLRCLHTIYNVPHFAILILVLIRLLQRQQQQQRQQRRRQQRQQHQLPFPVCALRRVALLIVSNLSASLAAIFHLLPFSPLFLSTFLVAVTCVRQRLHLQASSTVPTQHTLFPLFPLFPHFPHSSHLSLASRFKSPSQSQSLPAQSLLKCRL